MRTELLLKILSYALQKVEANMAEVKESSVDSIIDMLKTLKR